MNKSALCLFIVAGGFLSSGVLVAQADDVSGSTSTIRESTSDVPDLNAPVDALVPRVSRSLEDSDKLQAIALFTSGRMLEQKRDTPGAITLYQRALRFDPDSPTLLRQVVALLSGTNRGEETLRYAVKLARKDRSDPSLVRKVAQLLASRDDYATAIELLELLVQQPGTSPSGDRTVLSMELGRLYFLNQQYEQAAEHFALVQAALADPKQSGLQPAQVRQLTADKDLVYEIFAEAFMESNRFDDAAVALDHLQKRASGKQKNSLHQARLLRARGQSQAAYEELERYLAASPKIESTQPYELLEHLLLALQQQNQLTAKLQALSQADPDNLWLTYYLGKTYQQQADYAQAARYYEQVLKQKPSLEAYQGLLASRVRLNQPEQVLQLLSQVVRDSGTFEPVKTELRELLAQAELLEAVFAYAQTLVDADADVHANTDAEAKAQPQALAEPAEPEAEAIKSAQRFELLRAATLLALDAQKLDLVAQFYATLPVDSHKTEHAQILLSWGVELLRAERFAEAAEIFQRGLDEKLLAENNPVFTYYLAGALALAGKSDEALAAAQAAAKIQPKSALFEARIGWVHFHAKAYDKAVAAYQALLDKFGKDHSSTQIRDVIRSTRLMLSNIYVMQHNHQAAERMLEEVLNEFPDDVGASNDLGYLWADANKHLPTALRMIQFAVDAEPENHAYRDSLGWAYFRLGRFSEAKQQLLLAVKSDRPDAVVLEHLGEIYRKLGDKTAALDTYLQAIGLLEKEDPPDLTRLERLRGRVEELSGSSSGDDPATSASNDDTTAS